MFSKRTDPFSFFACNKCSLWIAEWRLWFDDWRTVDLSFEFVCCIWILWIRELGQQVVLTAGHDTCKGRAFIMELFQGSKHGFYIKELKKVLIISMNKGLNLGRQIFHSNDHGWFWTFRFCNSLTDRTSGPPKSSKTSAFIILTPFNAS